jgi:hypothetical protein
MSEPLIEARTLLALQALQNEPGLSTRRAAIIYKNSEHRLRFVNVAFNRDAILSNRQDDYLIRKSR